jgi:hypothetical protein
MSGRERDKHAIMVEQFLDEVLADKRSRGYFIVAWAVGCYFNRSTGIAWAGIDEYATRARIDRRNVQRGLACLVATGHLSVVRGGGRKLTNHYRPILKNSGADAALSDTGNSGADATVSAPERAAPVAQKGGAGDARTVKKGGAGATQPLKDKRPLRTADSLCASPPDSGSRFEASRPTRQQIEAAFRRFMAVYPKRVAKLAARKAFATAIKQGADPEAIIAVAARYATERAGQDARYTKHPTTWLNGGCWEDEPPSDGEAPMIDGATGAVIPAPRAQRRGGPHDHVWAKYSGGTRGERD